MRDASHRRWLCRALACVVVLVAVDGRAAPQPPATPDGEVLFLSECSNCHGNTGRGDGPDAFLFAPAPRNLHDAFLDRYPAGELVGRILDGASLRLPFDPELLRARAHETEAVVAHLQAIPQGNWRLTGHGQRIYMTRCYACHGAFGRPGKTGSAEAGRTPPDLSAEAFQHSLTDSELLTAVRHGRSGMPPIPTLREDDDARALVAFVRALSPGFELYSRYCAVCHGTDGHPAHVVESSRRPTAVFDRQYFEHHDPDRLRLEIWHMLKEKKPMMPHFRGELSESGARAIVEYLRKSK